jgi:cyclophilin family peptidyl-prolyl cis-trans isomerase
MNPKNFFLSLLFALNATAQDSKVLEANNLEAVVQTELGVFRLEFYPSKAPQHVNFFIGQIRAKYYDGSAFHRVFPYSLIQGGDPLLKDPTTKKELWGTGGLRLLKEEFSDLKHERGVVSTVSIPGVKDSGGAQFFVCIAPQPPLDGKYSAFGRVTEGMEVVEKISQAPAGEGGVLAKPIRIVGVTLDKKKTEPYIDAKPEEIKKNVRIETTLGTFRAELRPDWAPENVRNFLKLAASQWYEGTSFHRIAKGFVIQGGAEGMRQANQSHPADRWVRPVNGEFTAAVKHERGILSMARGDDPNSATTSFFIVLAPSPHLDGKYSAFGRVIEGMEVIEAFEKEEVDGEAPKRRLEILKVSVE